MGRWAIINVFLGLVVVLLGVEVARTWARSLPPVEIAQRSAAPPPEKREKGGGKRGPAEKGGGHADTSPVVLVAAIAEKDLFDVSRQRQAEEVARAVEQPRETGPPPGVVVAGIRIFGKDREAFVTENGVAKRLRTGDQVGGYTVKAIDATGVVLNSPSGDGVTMPLVVEAKGAPGAPGAPGKPPTVPGRPGLPPPQAGQPGSPAAGVQAASPAAGIQPKAPPVPPAPRMPGGAAAAAGSGATPPQPIAPGMQNPQNQNSPPLPNDVRQKLERLKQNSGSNSRLGRGRHPVGD